MAKTSIKQALAAAIVVAASTVIGVGSAARPAHAGGVFMCNPQYKTIPDSQLGNYDVIRVIYSYVSGGMRYDEIYYNTNQACKE